MPSIALFALSLLSQNGPRVRRGSLVVGIVPRSEDYVVLAAESRSNIKKLKTQVSSGEQACKIISLNGDTLFYETGASSLESRGRESWSSPGTARAVYKQSKTHDATTLSLYWGQRAFEWFDLAKREDLQSISEATEGRIAIGGFVNFTNGRLSLEAETISYDKGHRSITRRPFDKPPKSGYFFTVGAATGLVKEFMDAETDRAIKAFQPEHAPGRLIGFDSGKDAEIIGKAVKFAIDYATGSDRSDIGGPIDIAILRRNEAVEWVRRKTNCYEMDLKPVPK